MAVKEIYRIPYMGSKQKYAIRILDKITECLERDDLTEYTFYDLFGGGGAMTTTAYIYYPFQEVIYNELDMGIAELFKACTSSTFPDLILSDGKKISGKIGKYSSLPNIFYEWVDRETFFTYKNEPNWFGGFLKSVWSFGNTGKWYMYGKNIEEIKKRVHNLLVFNKNTFGDLPEDFLKLTSLKEKRLKLKNIIPEEFNKIGKGIQNLSNLERLQNLERLESLTRLQNIEKNSKLKSYNLSFEKIKTNEKNSVIYLDPPYLGTKTYNEGLVQEDLISYIKNKTADGIPVFVSEYNNPCPEVLKEVLEIKTRSTLGSSNNAERTERLFWNGKK